MKMIYHQSIPHDLRLLAGELKWKGNPETTKYTYNTVPKAMAKTDMLYLICCIFMKWKGNSKSTIYTLFQRQWLKLIIHCILFVVSFVKYASTEYKNVHRVQDYNN